MTLSSKMGSEGASSAPYPLPRSQLPRCVAASVASPAAPAWRWFGRSATTRTSDSDDGRYGGAALSDARVSFAFLITVGATRVGLRAYLKTKIPRTASINISENSDTQPIVASLSSVTRTPLCNKDQATIEDVTTLARKPVE